MNDTTPHFPGLLAGSDVDRSELHGFEVDLSGRVVAPEFGPQRLCTGALHARIEFESEIGTALDNAP